MPDAPQDLVKIVEKAMAREASGRYATAKEVSAELRRFVDSQFQAAHAAELRDRWFGKHKPWLIAVGVLVLALAGYGVVALIQLIGGGSG